MFDLRRNEGSFITLRLGIVNSMHQEKYERGCEALCGDLAGDEPPASEADVSGLKLYGLRSRNMKINRGMMEASSSRSEGNIQSVSAELTKEDDSDSKVIDDNLKRLLRPLLEDGIRKRLKQHQKDHILIGESLHVRAQSNDDGSRCVEILDDIPRPLPVSFWTLLDRLNKQRSSDPCCRLQYIKLQPEDIPEAFLNVEDTTRLEKADDLDRNKSSPSCDDVVGDEFSPTGRFDNDARVDILAENSCESYQSSQVRKNGIDRKVFAGDLVEQSSSRSLSDVTIEPTRNLFTDELTENTGVGSNNGSHSCTNSCEFQEGSRPKSNQLSKNSDKFSEYSQYSEGNHSCVISNTNVTKNDPYILSQWPPHIRKRSFAYGMPKPTLRVFGSKILYWAHVGGFEGLPPCCVRVKDNWALAQALWLGSRLKLQVEAICFLPLCVAEAHASLIEKKNGNGNDCPSGKFFPHIPCFYASAFLELKGNFERFGVPLLGLFVERQDIAKLLQKYIVHNQVHIVLFNESYHPEGMDFLKSIGNLLPCPLYSIDSDSFLSPRYIRRHLKEYAREDDPNLDKETYVELLSACIEQEVSSMDWISFLETIYFPNNICGSSTPQRDTSENIVNGESSKLWEGCSSKWQVIDSRNLVELECTQLATNPISSTRVRVRESQAALVIEETSCGDSQSQSSVEDLRTLLRCGIISPMQVYKKSRKLHPLLFDHGFMTYSAYWYGRWSTKPTKSMNKKISPALCELLKCPGDLFHAKSDDASWNDLQESLLTSARIDTGCLKFWLTKLKYWCLYEADGTELAISWLKTHMHGGQSAEVFALVHCCD